MNALTIGKRQIGAEHPPLIIADIGLNHNGNLLIATEMIAAAKNSGCECIKTQIHIADKEMLCNDNTPKNIKQIYDNIKKFQLTKKEDYLLRNAIINSGLLYLATPFCFEAVDILEEFNVTAYKIGSGEARNPEFIKYIAKKGKPIIFSIGNCRLSDIDLAVDIFAKNNISYALLHCESYYPTPYSLSNIKMIPFLKKRYPNAIIGFSDHSPGIYMSQIAIGMGASIIEKHFMLKNIKCVDQDVSIEKNELAILVDYSQKYYTATKDVYIPFGARIKETFWFDQSVTTKRKIKNGEVFTKENIISIRPGTGEILAINYNYILGKKAARDIEKYTQLKYSDIQ